MTADVTRFGHRSCPFVHRVAWALGERGIEHDVVEVPPSAMRPEGFALPDAFVDNSPRLEIPLVRVDDRYLADSVPILERLETAVPDAPRLLPSLERAAELVRSRMRWFDAVFVPYLVRESVLRRLGFDHPLPDALVAYRERVGDRRGWAAVEWTEARTGEPMARMRGRRRKARAERNQAAS